LNNISKLKALYKAILVKFKFWKGFFSGI